MILILDEEHKVMKLTSSIMRDFYVNILEYGYDKITQAYALGNPKFYIKTLDKKFKVNVEDFMSVNFTFLPEIIEKLGGVKINIILGEFCYILGIT